MSWLKNSLIGFGVTGFICLFLFFAFLGGICLHYDLHFWLTYAKHTETNPSWIMCLLIGLIPGVGQISIPGAFITWICSLFL